MACKGCTSNTSVGSRNTPVVVQQLILTEDATGGQVKSFATVGTLWCKVEQNSGKEGFIDEQLREIGDHTFMALWVDVVFLGLTAGYRLLTQGDLPGNLYYNVRSVQNVDLDGAEAKILAERGVIS